MNGDTNVPASFREFLIQHLFTILIVFFAALIIWKGLKIMAEQIRKSGIGPNNIQTLGLFIIVPVDMVLGAERAIDGRVVSAILGSLVGYVFGVRQGTEAQT